MKRSLLSLLLLLAGSASMQGAFTSSNPEVQKKLDACKHSSEPTTSGIAYRYDMECIERVKKEHPGEVQEDEITSVVHAGQ